MGFSKIRVPYLGILILGLLAFRVLYWGLLFSETSIWDSMHKATHVRQSAMDSKVSELENAVKVLRHRNLPEHCWTHPALT